MTQQEIIEMARQAEFVNLDLCSSELERFAKLVAHHERERIFGEFLKMHEIASSRHNYYLNAVLTIRARGDNK
jgi:hypothetical protein